MANQPSSPQPDLDAQAAALGTLRTTREEIQAMMGGVDQAKINRLFYAGDINKIRDTIHQMNPVELKAVIEEAQEEIQERAEAGRMPLWRFGFIGALTSLMTVAVSYPLARYIGRVATPSFRDYVTHRASWAFMGASTLMAPLSAFVDRRATNAPEILELARSELRQRHDAPEMLLPEVIGPLQAAEAPKPQAVTDIAPEGQLAAGQKRVSL